MNESEFNRGKCHPYGVYALAAANIVYFMILLAVGGESNTSVMIRWGALYTGDGGFCGGWYRMFTSMFMHFDIYHLGSNLLMLAAVGEILEEHLGTVRVVSAYLIGGFAGNAATLLWCYFSGKSVVSAGASGAVFALVGVLCCIVLRNRKTIPGIRKERVFLMVFLMLYSGFSNAEVNMAAHIGGFLTGLLGGCFLSVKE